MRNKSLCPDCSLPLKGASKCSCGWTASRELGGTVHTCHGCGIALPPYKQVRARQARNEPCGYGHLVGRYPNEYYLCTQCHIKESNLDDATYWKTVQGKQHRRAIERGDSEAVQNYENLRTAIANQ